MITTTATTARAPGVRGEYSKSETRRRSIVDAAGRLFAEGGYNATSTRDVAEAAGISEAGMRHHFPTKVALLQGVLAAREEKDFEASDPSRTGLGTLRRLLAIVERNAQERHAVELYAMLSAEASTPDHPAHAYFVSRYAWVLKLLEEAAADLRERGILREGIIPASFARSLTAVLDGLQVQWLLDPSVDMVRETRRYIDTQLTEPLASA